MGNFSRFFIIAVILLSVVATYLFIGTQKPRLIWNTTSSLPKGFYKIEEGYTYGDIIAFDIPENFRDLVKEREWIPLYDRLLKRIVGMQGDVICIRDTEVYLNNNYFGKTALTDSKGRDMPQIDGCHTVKKGHVWVMLKDNVLSLDSRYFGQISEEIIYGKAVPILQY